MGKKKWIIITVLGLLALFILSIPTGIYLSNNLNVKEYDITTGKDLDITIAHISDLHYPKTKITIEEIINELERLSPGFVFLTGDIIDSSTIKDDITKLDTLLKKLKDYKNVYAVFGNHELINDNLDYYKSLLKKNNIILLEDKAVKVSYKGKDYVIAGVSDKVIYGYDTVEGLDKMPKESILLLAHRPEKWQDYMDSTTNHKPMVTFSGHVHGGQARIFGIGLVSPATGAFPKYTSGLYKSNDKKSYLLVSRGLGDSIFPYRYFNSYHLPILRIF